MNLLWLWITLGAASGAALISLFVWFNNSCIKTTRYKIKISGAPELKIIHLSDLHGKRFGKDNRKLVRKVAALSPDFIAITGDIIHLYTPKNTETALLTVSALKEIAPVIYIAGNHEMRNKGYRFLRKDLKEAGATVLDDQTAEVCGISVTGLNGASLRNDKIFEVAPKASPKILLAHEPQFFEKYAEAGFDLVLCGHAHGGQWRIPFTGKGLYAPGHWEELTSKTDCNILSVREKQVLILIEQGLTSRDIADRLCISRNTVSRHRQEILARLQVKNSTEACRRAKQLGLI